MSDVAVGCEHNFVTTPEHVAVREIDLGESIGSRRVFVLRRTRACAQCGLNQQQIQWNPDERWSDWKDTFTLQPQ